MLPFDRKNVKEVSKGLQSHHSARVATMGVHNLSGVESHGKGITQEAELLKLRPVSELLS